MTPRISILLPAMRGYETVLAALDAWEGQTWRERLEVLILCPDHLGPTAAQRASLRPNQIIVPIGAASLHEARAIGVAHASGDYVMLAEDHCLPDPDWAQAIMERLEEGWDGVGAALRPGNRVSHWAEASFLIGYGEWMIPVTGGPTDVLCGLNGTLRTRLLREMGSELRDEMLLGAFLVRRLRAQGGRFYLEDRARMRHFDPASSAFALSSLFALGLAFGARRTRSWPLPARILYPIAAPAVALLHGKRAFVQSRRAGPGSGLRPTAPLMALILASAWALGEAVGAWMGIARVEPYVWRAETRPVSREDVARSTAREQSAVPRPDARIASGSNLRGR
jgi:glycosyltransferase involved in cell wall biosynthesis